MFTHQEFYYIHFLDTKKCAYCSWYRSLLHVYLQKLFALKFAPSRPINVKVASATHFGCDIHRSEAAKPSFSQARLFLL